MSVLFPTVSMGTWHHVAGVYEPSVRLEVYLDGVSAAKRTASVPAAISPTGALPRRMGAISSGTTWNGAIDEVYLYARALTPSEIADLAQR